MMVVVGCEHNRSTSQHIMAPVVGVEHGGDSDGRVGSVSVVGGGRKTVMEVRRPVMVLSFGPFVLAVS